MVGSSRANPLRAAAKAVLANDYGSGSDSDSSDFKSTRSFIHVESPQAPSQVVPDLRVPDDMHELKQDSVEASSSEEAAHDTLAEEPAQLISEAGSQTVLRRLSRQFAWGIGFLRPTFPAFATLSVLRKRPRDKSEQEIEMLPSSGARENPPPTKRAWCAAASTASVAPPGPSAACLRSWTSSAEEGGAQHKRAHRHGHRAGQFTSTAVGVSENAAFWPVPRFRTASLEQGAGEGEQEGEGAQPKEVALSCLSRTTMQLY